MNRFLSEFSGRQVQEGARLLVSPLQHIWAGRLCMSMVMPSSRTSSSCCFPLPTYFIAALSGCGCPQSTTRPLLGRISLQALDPSGCSPDVRKGSHLPATHIFPSFCSTSSQFFFQVEAHPGTAPGAMPFLLVFSPITLRHILLLPGPSDALPNGVQRMDKNRISQLFSFPGYGLRGGPEIRASQSRRATSSISSTG